MARARVDTERREQILEAFEACVIRQGLDATSLEDVAREVGQPRSLVRYFVGNRDELIAKLVDRLLERTSERVASMRARSNGDVALLVRLYFEEFFSHDASNRIVIELWRMGVHSPSVASRVFALYNEILLDLTRDLTTTDQRRSPEATFDGAYAAFSLGLGMSVLRNIGVNPTHSGPLTKLAHDLALGSLDQNQTKSDEQES